MAAAPNFLNNLDTMLAAGKLGQIGAIAQKVARVERRGGQRAKGLGALHDLSVQR
ncbi:hypothetical protein [Burkholderia ambifaria]|uniref:hypothetical protein n=1 Tax=Burkholderia ambifaria TaxID=152480 RepID=UPI002FE13360